MQNLVERLPLLRKGYIQNWVERVALLNKICAKRGGESAFTDEYIYDT